MRAETAFHAATLLGPLCLLWFWSVEGVAVACSRAWLCNGGDGLDVALVLPLWVGGSAAAAAAGMQSLRFFKAGRSCMALAWLAAADLLLCPLFWWIGSLRL